MDTEKIREEFLKEFGMNIGGDAAQLVFNQVADWWLSKFSAYQEELRNQIEDMIEEELVAEPADDLEKTAEWYKVSALKQVLSLITPHEHKEK